MRGDTRRVKNFLLDLAFQNKKQNDQKIKINRKKSVRRGHKS